MENPPRTLFRADPVPINAHLDARRVSDADQAALLEAIKRLPPRAEDRPAALPAAPLLALDEALQIEYDVIEPHEMMLDALLADLSVTSNAIALRDWKAGKRELDHLSDEEWLLFASIQLENEGIPLAFVREGAAIAGDFQTPNEFSDDVIAGGGAA